MTEQGGHERTHVWAVLKRDRAFWAASTLLAVGLAPYFLPGLPTDQRLNWGYYYADIPVYAATLVAVLVGLARIADERERQFWRLIAFAVGAALLAECSNFIPTELWTSWQELTVQAVFLCFYLGMALAVEASRPRRGEDAVRRLLWLRTVGLGILLLGLLVYFEVVPTTMDAESWVPWIPSLFIFASLDVALCGAFVRARNSSTDRRWRTILGGMAVVMAANAAVDAAEAAFFLEPLVSMELSPLADLPWFVPSVLLILLARVHIASPRVGPDEGEVGPRVVTVGGGPLLAYLLALPVLHSSLSAVGLLDPAFDRPRSVVLALVSITLGILAFLYQRVAERQNEAAHRELSISRERYQSFLRTSGEGIYRAEFTHPVSVTDPVDKQVAQIRSQLRIAEANLALAEMHGRSDPSEMVGMLFSELEGENDHAPLQLSFVEAGYEARDVVSSGIDAKGEPRFFRNSVAGVVEGGLLLRIWGTKVDVTEERLRDVEKERLEDELRHSQRMETIGTLAGGIAHDFNNILAPIVGFVDLATEEIPPESTRIRSYLDHVGKAAKRAQDLVNQILIVSRRQKAQKVPVRIQDIVEEALTLLRPTLPSTIHIHTDVDAGCPPVIADSGQIHQVLMNLCTNARQAIGDSAGNLTISLRWATREMATFPSAAGPGGQIVITVSDDGPGMVRDVADRIFEPFFTTKAVGEGTGLGLSVAHGIVAEHGGELRVDTTPGTGATFLVYLPATDSSVDVPTPRAATGSESQGRVLLVDDDEAVAAVAETMLERIGFDVTTFADSEAAMLALRADPFAFDLLFTDHTMPGITGPELAQVARALNPEMAIVITSGYRLADASLASTDFEQLGKPFSRADIAAAVARARERSRSTVL